MPPPTRRTAAPRFIEHRSDRLHLLVRGAEHAPQAPRCMGGSGHCVQAGLYVTLLVHGSLQLRCGDCASAPRSGGMQVLAVREPLPWSAQGQACALCAVGVSMLRADLRARALEGWFDGLFAPHQALRQVQVAAEPRCLALAQDILGSDPCQPLALMRLEAAAQTIFLRGIAALEQARAPAPHERLLHLADALEADLARAWTLDDMARLAGMSARSLSAAFRRELGDSPFGWLRQRRLLRGRHMVLDEGLPIALAAERLGFSSAAHFSTAFRAHFGQTPSQMRRQSGLAPGQQGGG